VRDAYGARAEAGRKSNYRPLPPEQLYLSAEEWESALATRPNRRFSAFNAVEGEQVIDLGARAGRSFAPERQRDSVNLFEATVDHAKALSAAGKRVLFASWSEGASERLGGMLADHGLSKISLAPYWQAAKAADPKTPQRVVLPLEAGFETDKLAVISETDILGDRLARPRKRRRAANFLAEASALTPGDLVVHIEHGIGRYEGLKTLDIQGAPHDCLELQYGGEAKLYLPVENIDLLSRYGAESEGVVLDRLGGAAWQARKARAKERLREMAGGLIRIAAERAMKTTPGIDPPQGVFDEFCARFPYEETEDQLNAIGDVLTDLGSGRPMDRLICGDVGFGKTEVALRAAFVAAMSGQQVAVVCPTTLLARQHFKTFEARFQGWPVKVRRLSRLVPPKEAAETRQGLKTGEVEIVVGTHAVLSKQVAFKDLGLVIVDEEQHFGVKHKEQLKELRADVHMLTLTATPIPRTLNMAMSGMRDISIIATPPQKRLSVKTFVQQKDDTAIKEAILRELLRGGQVYYLHNDIDTMARTAEDIRKLVPDARVGIAHGQMRERELEAVMSDFYHRRFNVLVCSTIIETGIDVPSANTIIIERADKLGLAQLHQLRGRVGRSHHQAYAYLTTPGPRAMTKDALKRLEAIEQATDLGAGFVLASQDLEIRGAGELLGEEQHGNMESIGFSLYMEMLEQAVEALKRGEQPDTAKPLSGGPEVNLRIPALIPEDYLPDVYTRLTLYKRIAGSKNADQLKELQVEMIDRFGLLPDPVKNLFQVTELRQQAEKLGITRLDAHGRGGKLEFAERTPVDPLTIVKLVQSGPNVYKLEGASTLRFELESETAQERIEVVGEVLNRLSGSNA
jgi:transcription-repair coupling factor (superfamily II helicase)